MDEPVKLCIKCKHLVTWDGFAEYPIHSCEHELSKTYTPNLVLGGTNVVAKKCEKMRSPGEPCGPEGKLHEVW